MANSISLAIYTIRVRSLRGTENLQLQGFDISCDLLQDLHLFLTNLSTQSSLDTQNQRRLFVKRFIPTDRITKGIIETGEYGYESSIVDIQKDTETYRRKIYEAEMLPFYFNVVLPKNSNEGLICFQRLGQHGIKTSFFTAFSSYFIDSHPNYRIEFNQLVAQQMLTKLISEGFIRKVRLIQFGVPKDIEDLFDEPQKEEAGTTEMVISAKRNGQLPLIPRLKEVLVGQRRVTNFVELEGFDYQRVKVEFVINGKHRIVDLSQLDDLNALYDITQDIVIGQNGHPTFESIDRVAQEITNEIYRGIGIKEEDVLQN